MDLKAFKPMWPDGNVFMLQLCDQHAGADGGRGLHDCVPEWSHTPQKDARPWLAEEMLPDD